MSKWVAPFLFILLMASVAFGDGVSYGGKVKRIDVCEQGATFHGGCGSPVFQIGNDITVAVRPGSTAESWLAKAQGFEVRIVVEQVWK